jgi:hypothetical protein
MTAALLALSGCDSDEEDLCEFECECEGCSARRYDDCRDSYDRTARDAEFRRCYDLYDAWIDCRDATAFCDRDFEFETNCGPEHARLNSCLDR